MGHVRVLRMGQTADGIRPYTAVLFRRVLRSLRVLTPRELLERRLARLSEQLRVTPAKELLPGLQAESEIAEELKEVDALSEGQRI